MPSSNVAIFLDRDGTLNQKAPEGEYITTLDQFVLLTDVLLALVRLYQQGFLLFVVTNQRGLARGLVSPEDLGRIHQSLMRQVETAGAKIERIVVCPHDLADQCECRKPKPGLILRLAAEYGLHLEKCWMVGDNRSDVAAGKAAGCHTAYLGHDQCLDADVTAQSLADAASQLLSFTSPPRHQRW